MEGQHQLTELQATQVITNSGHDDMIVSAANSCSKSKNILEASKALGSVQFSLGDALGLSRTKSRLRVDMCLPHCDVKLDGSYLIKKGDFVPGALD